MIRQTQLEPILAQFTGLDALLKDPKQKLTLLAADDAAFARLFADCKARGVSAVNKPPACALADMLKPGFKAKAAKLLKYHLLQVRRRAGRARGRVAGWVVRSRGPPPHALAAAASPQGVVPVKVDRLTWNPSDKFNQLPTLLEGQKMKLRYTAGTKTFEAHGTGRDAFVRQDAGAFNVACGAGLMHAVDNLATLRPGTL